MIGTRASRKRERVCPWCSRSFTKDEHLARHIRTHTREKPFTCETCQRTFSRHDSLLRHARRHRSCSILSAPETGSENQSLDSTNKHEHATQQISPAPLSAQNSTEIQPRAQPGPPQPNAAAFLNPASVNNGSNVETIIPNSSVAILPSTAGDLTRASATDLLLTGSYPGPAAATAGLDLTSHTPTWFAGDDFDLDAFNAAIMFSTTCSYPSGLGQLVNDEPINSINYSHQPSVDNRPPPVEDLIRDNWFTFIKEPGSGSMTPDNAPEQIHVDEAYRERLAVKLQHSVPNLPLPSTDFLNLCVQMYFTRFHPIFPVLHVPTFRPSAKRSLLLLSICSIGSLFLGSAHAASQGLKIFETLNKAILSSWEKCIMNGGSEAIAMVQAALLGQTFGLLSRRKKDLLTAQTFHGAVVAWARRFNMFRTSCASDHTNHNIIASHPQQAWKTWIRVEERNRVAAGLCIHDVEIAEISHSNPLLRNCLFKVPPVSDEILWGAPTADVWAKAMAGLPSHSSVCDEYSLLQTPASFPGRSDVADKVIWNKGLRAYLELEGIAACIIEGRGLEDFSRREQYAESLIHLYNSHIKIQRKEGHDIYLLSVLWHSAFISLYADLNRLELAVGKEGHDEAQQHLNYVREWACSQVGQRCALHAVMILRDLEGMRLGTEPPIHVPRILFRAAITWFCYSKFGTDTLELSQQQPLDFTEFKILGINCQRLLFEANGYRNFRPNTPESCTFRGLIDILQRVGHWGISKNYASILSLLLPEGTKDEKQG